MPPETELFLILGARAAFVREVVEPCLRRGQLVLADRFDFSTFAYQGYGRGLDLAEVRRANALATGGLRPDLVLVLDLPETLGLLRKKGEGEADRIEREGAPFLRRVREGYLALAREEPGVRLLNADESPENLQAEIRRVLTGAFPGTFGNGSVQGEGARARPPDKK